MRATRDERWPSRRMPQAGEPGAVRYEVDGAVILSPERLVVLFDIMAPLAHEVGRIEFQDYLLVFASGPYACMVTLSSPDQPGDAIPGQLHISITRGLGGRRAPPTPEAELRFLSALADCWPGQTRRVAPSAGESFIAHHFVRDLGGAFVDRLVGCVDLWERQADMHRPARAWGALDPLAAATRYPETLRALVRWGVASNDDLSALGAATALAVADLAPVIALDDELLDALLHTNPPKVRPTPFETFTIDMMREVDGARLLVIAKVPDLPVASIFALPEAWPAAGEVKCTARHEDLVANVCAYMTHVDRGETRSNEAELAEMRAAADRRRGTKKRKLLRRLDRTPATSTVRLGGRVGSLGPAAPSGGHESGPRREHTVRAHWRDQPYGPRSVPLEERPRRLVWIAAHTRCEGSAAGRVEARTYLASPRPTEAP